MHAFDRHAMAYVHAKQNKRTNEQNKQTLIDIRGLPNCRPHPPMTY